MNASKAFISRIDAWQRKRQRMFKSVPIEGKTIVYLGKKFLVYKNTFWPFTDSKPLVKNFKIKNGENILDIGTGSGIIAIFACYQGAGKVTAIDINPWALKSAKYNVTLHGFKKIIKVKKSDLFENIRKEKFDVITANLPFRNKVAHDLVARSQWDTNLETIKRFFREAGAHLNPNGRIYFAQSNFGAMAETRILAKKAGFSMKMTGSETGGKRDIKKFYAFLVKKKNKPRSI